MNEKDKDRWIKEYINDIDLSNIKWEKFTEEELKKFYDDNYFDESVWKYVTDENSFILSSPIGLTYLSLICYNDNYNYLLGLVDNNIGKKTIVSAMVFMDNYFAFKEQKVPLTYISSIETNLYFLNMGIYTKLCNEIIKFIIPEQHIIISDESEMGRKLGVINKLREILLKNGFNKKILIDDYFDESDLGIENVNKCKKIKLR